MLRKLVAVSLLMMLVSLLSAASFAEDQAKQGRVEGRILRSDKDKSLLTVRGRNSGAETDVVYDASTKWTSQYHGDKKVNTIDASAVKDGDFVICRGSYDKKGVLHATTISKRLSHSPQ